MLIAPRVSEPLESDVPPVFHGQTSGDVPGEAEAAHEHHHPAMTTYNTTVKTASASSRPKSTGAVYIHRCPFQDCTHGHRFLQPLEASEAETSYKDHSYHIQDSYHTHQEPSGYTSISNENLHTSFQGYEGRQEHQLRNYSWSDPGCDSSPCEAAMSPTDQWHSDSYISTQDQYSPRYSTEGVSRLVSRGLHPSDEPSAMAAESGPRTRSSAGSKFPKVSMGYRQRAIDCMLRQLRVSSDSSDGPSTIQVIKQTINQLEDQLYHHAQTKDEYQLLVASKLYAILQQLAERQQRSASPVRYQGPAPTLRT